MAEEPRQWQIMVNGVDGKTTMLNITSASPPDEPVDVLFQEFSKKVGIPVDEIRLLFAGKQLMMGQGKKLKDYGLQSLSTVHAVLRLRGGSAPGLTRGSAAAPPEAEEKTYDVSDMTLKFTDKPCDLDPYMTDPDTKRAVLSCGHCCDPNSLTGYVRSLVDTGACTFTCPALVTGAGPGKKTCGKAWDYTEVRHLALLNPSEAAYLERKLAENAITTFWDAKEHMECGTWAIRADPANPRVVCSRCTAQKKKLVEFCWLCMKPWVGSGVKCGNAECPPEMQKLKGCPRFDIGTEIKDVPTRRACPTCGMVIEHKGGCKHMLCKRCVVEFCFSCLRLRSGCTTPAYSPCASGVAPEQTSIPVWRARPEMPLA